MSIQMDSSQEQLVVEVNFEIEKDAEGYPKSRDVEALLCKPLVPDCSQCLVMSVPFYLRNVAYGDTIITTENNNGNLYFKEIVNHGGYSVYRVLLHDKSQKDQLIKTLLHYDAVVEKDGNLIAFAVLSPTDADALVEYLLKGKAKGYWGVQDGFIFESSD
jgi:hypothetical protein